MTQDEIEYFKTKIRETIQGIVGGDKIINADVIDLKRWSVVVETELGAYKVAYAYRKLIVRVSPAPNVGGWLTTIGY